MPTGVVTVEALGTANENGTGSPTFRFTRTGSLADTAYGAFTVGGTATGYADYDAAIGYLYFPVGEDTWDVPVTILDDDDYEGATAETITASGLILYDSGGSYTVGTPASAQLEIVDDDPAPLVSVERLADAAEGGATGTFRFSRTGPTGQSLVVSYSVESTGVGCATAGTDYTSLSGTVTIAAYAEYADVTVTASSDSVVEGAEWVSVTVDDAAAYDPGWSDAATVVIVDKTAEVSVAGLGNIKEGEADGVFRFTRTGDTTDPLTVTYTVVTVGPSMADDRGTDYTTLSGTVTFAASSATADVLVETVDDGYREPDELVSIVIDESEEDYTIGWAYGSLWITDDDGRMAVWISDDDGYWDDAENWSINEVPGPDDDVYFVNAAGAYAIGATEYGLGNMLGFEGGSKEFDFEGDPEYAGVHVLGYSSTITLDMPLSVGTLEMKADEGVLDQPYGTSSEITITTYFNWTAGTLNSASTSSTVTLSGAAGEITPDDIVSTGSTLRFLDGSAVTVSEGTVSFTGGLGTVVESASLVIQAANGTATFSNNASGTSASLMMHYAGFGGSIKVDGIWASTNGFPVFNDGGMFVVEANSEARLTGLAGPTGTRGSYYQQGTEGVLLLSSTGKLKAEGDVRITGGRLLTVASTTPNQPAVVDGTLRFSGHNIVLGDPAYTNGPAHIFSRLRITGEFYWTSGVFRPFVGRTAANLLMSDQIECLGRASIVVGVNGATLGPIGPVNPGNFNHVGTIWHILVSPIISLVDENDNDAILLPYDVPQHADTWENNVDTLGDNKSLQLEYNPT